MLQFLEDQAWHAGVRLGEGNVRHEHCAQRLLRIALLHMGCGGVLQKGGGVRRVAEPLAAHAGVCRRAKAQIVAAVPVDKVMLPLVARLCKVGDLVLAVAVVFQLLHGVKIEIGGFIAGAGLRVLLVGRDVQPTLSG